MGEEDEIEESNVVAEAAASNTDGAAAVASTEVAAAANVEVGVSLSFETWTVNLHLGFRFFL